MALIGNAGRISIQQSFRPEPPALTGKSGTKSKEMSALDETKQSTSPSLISSAALGISVYIQRKLFLY